MKRLFTLIVLLGMLGVFAGCNSGDSTTSSTSTNAPSSGTVTNATK